MATAKQLKALRKKFHLGEFRKSKSRKVYKVRASYSSMAKRKRRTSRRSRGIMSSGLVSDALGVAGYVAFENYIEPRIPISEPILSFAELATGVWLSKKGGIVGSIGKAAVYVNIYQLIKFYLGSATGGQSTVTGMFAYN